VPPSATSKADVESDADDQNRRTKVREAGGAGEGAGGERGEGGEGWERRDLEAASASTSGGGGGGGGDTKREEDGEGGGGEGGERRAGAPSSTSGGGGGDANVWDIAGFLKENPHVLSICATTGLLMAGHSCVAPVLPIFASEFGATAAQVGMTLSAFAAARLVFNVPCGILADRYGRRPLIVVGPLITAVGMLGSAAAVGLPELCMWRFVAGAGSAVYMSGAQALLADISRPSNRARVLGFNQAAAGPHLNTFSCWNNEPFVPQTT